MKKTFAVILVFLLFLPVPPGYSTREVLVEEGTENVVLLCKHYNFKKETDEFKDFRYKYGLLWTGIISALVIYSYVRVK